MTFNYFQIIKFNTLITSLLIHIHTYVKSCLFKFYMAVQGTIATTYISERAF